MRIEVNIIGIKADDADDRVFTAMAENLLELQAILTLPSGGPFAVVAQASLTNLDWKKYPDGTVRLCLVATDEIPNGKC